MKHKSNFLLKVIAIVAVLFIGISVVSAQKKVKTSVSGSNTEKQAIEKFVREYLLENPEIIREAMQALQAKEEKAKNQLIAEKLKSLNSEIYADQDSPIGGNPDGDVTIVAFFDYYCGYCRQSLPNLENLVANDKSVRIIYKEFPIMSLNSDVVARAALAAKRQGKYLEFHKALLETDETGEAAVEFVSKKLNLDLEQLQKDMNDPKIVESLYRNAKLAESLNISGTPAYIVGGQIIPGAIETDSLKKIVVAEREKLPKNKIAKVVTQAK
jgi:protein-disulfide isomerase